jgi:hypothetical protein
MLTEMTLLIMAVYIFCSGTEKEPGVIPRAVQGVFSYIEEVTSL